MLMFEVGSEDMSFQYMAEVIQRHNIDIISRPIRPNGRRPIIVKGAERDAGTYFYYSCALAAVVVVIIRRVTFKLCKAVYGPTHDL